MKKLFILLIIFLNIFVLQFNFTFAKNKNAKNKKQQTFELEEIVVSATKINQLLKTVPASITIINNPEILNSLAKNVSEILENKTGLDVRNQGALGNLVWANIRGTTEKQTLILLDGQPLNSSQNGGVDLNQIDLNLVEKIEVVKGAFSSVYGTNALGGVINIITKKNVSNNVKVSGISGSFNTIKSNINISNGLKYFNYFLAFSSTSTDGIRTNDNYKTQNYSIKIADKKNKANLFYYYYNSEKDVPGALSFPSTTAKQNDKKSILQLNFNNYFKENKSLSLKVFLQNDSVEYNDPNTAWPIYNLDKPQSSGIDMQYAIEGKDKILFGTEYKKDKLNSNTIGEKSFNNFAIYTNFTKELNNQTFLSLGFRNDKHSVYKNEFSPRMGITFNTKNNLLIKTSYGKGFRAPTFNDLYWPLEDYPDPNFGYGTSGNPNLKPETGWTYDLGLEKNFKKYNFKINFFNTSTKNLINWNATYDANYPGGFWKPENVDSAELQGIESEITTSLAKNINFSLNYQYLDVKDKNTKKFLPYKPWNTFNTSLDFTFNKNTNLNLLTKYVSKKYTDTANTTVLSSYINLSAKLQTKISEYTLYLKGENLLNKKYEEVKDYPMPERYLEVGLEKSFK